jgi:hypothetical protein
MLGKKDSIGAKPLAVSERSPQRVIHFATRICAPSRLTKCNPPDEIIQRLFTRGEGTFAPRNGYRFRETA